MQISDRAPSTVRPPLPRGDDPTAPAAPHIDQVSLAAFPAMAVPALPACPRAFWRETDGLGLTGAAAATGGALGRMLSTSQTAALLDVVQDLQRAGVRFQQDGRVLAAEDAARCCRDGRPVQVDGADMRASRFPVRSLNDLRALDALYVTRDFGRMENPALARAVDHVGALGLRLFKTMGPGMDFASRYEYGGGEVRDFGRYGAYKQYTSGLAGKDDPRPDQPLLLGFGEEEKVSTVQHCAIPTGRPVVPFKADVNLPIWTTPPRDPAADADDFTAMAWFKFKSPDAALEADPLAGALRDLQDAGYTFHGGPGHEWIPPWDLLRATGPEEVVLGIGGCPMQRVTVDALRGSKALDPATREVRQLFAETLKPQSDRYEIFGDYVGDFLAACRPPVGPLPDMKTRWMLLFELTQAGRAATGTVRYNLPQDIQNFRFLTALPGAGSESWRQCDVPLFEKLLATMPVGAAWPQWAERARATFPPWRAMLNRASSDQERSCAREVCTALLDGDTGRADVRLAALPREAPLREILATLREQVAQHQAVGGAQATVGEEALADYAAIDGALLPDESLAEGGRKLRQVQSFLAAREGWPAGRETFEFLQDGLRSGRFDGRTFDEALADLVRLYLARGDLAAARAAILREPRVRDVGSIQAEGDTVRIGGVRVPVRARG